MCKGDKTLPELPNGIPDSDTFRRIFERINPEELADALYDWLGAERKKRGVIAIGGKTICGSGNADHKAYKENVHCRSQSRKTTSCPFLEKVNAVTVAGDDNRLAILRRFCYTVRDLLNRIFWFRGGAECAFTIRLHGKRKS